MPNSDLVAAVERARERLALSRQALADSRASTPCALGRLGCRFHVGDRVFDRVTGLEGVVINGTVENVVIPTTQRENG